MSGPYPLYGQPVAKFVESGHFRENAVRMLEKIFHVVYLCVWLQ